MPGSGNPAAADRQRRRGAALLLAWVAALVVPGGGCRHEPVPVQLQGIWRTDAASHEDRFLSISDRSIAFGVGGNDAVVLGVADVESDPEGRQETRYVLHVVDAEGAPDDVVLYFREGSPLPSLRLAHESVVWRPHNRRPGDEP